MMRQRGTTLLEILTVTAIVGMLVSALVVIVPLMLKAPLQMQSQVDEVNTAAIALYKVRRDFSESNTLGIMGCSTSPVVMCSPVGPGPTNVQALAIATAEDNTGAFQVDKQTGYPEWTGFYIYWLVPNASGTAFDLMRAWQPAPIWSQGNPLPTNVSAALVTPLVAAAMLISPPPVLTNYITKMSVGVNNASSTISFQLVAGTVGGVDPNRTNFLSNTYARN